MMKQRDLSIDYLRFIGISMIILAHISAPFILTQFRCFDVPLMIFISGLTSSRKLPTDYYQYILARSKRLLVPVYFFLSLLFLILYLLQASAILTDYISLKKIIHTYLLLEGIGYVWIIRVFLLIMIFTPFLAQLEMKCSSNVIYGLICLLFMIFNDALLLYEFPLPGGKYLNILVTEFVMYLIGYVALFMLGLRMRYANNIVCRGYVWTAIICGAIGALGYYHVNGFPITITAYKYPPQFIFLIYGAIISICLWYFKKSISKIIDSLRLTSFATFIGQNTIWIYLWHIPFVMLYNALIDNWLFRFVAVYSCAIIVFKLQTIIVKKVNNAFVTKYLIG